MRRELSRVYPQRLLALIESAWRCSKHVPPSFVVYSSKYWICLWWGSLCCRKHPALYWCWTGLPQCLQWPQTSSTDITHNDGLWETDCGVSLTSSEVLTAVPPVCLPASTLSEWQSYGAYHKTTFMWSANSMSPLCPSWKHPNRPGKAAGSQQLTSPREQKSTTEVSGLCNPFWSFIKNYSLIAASLHQLTFIRRSSFLDPSCRAGMKQQFTSAPVLIFPDPSKQFVIAHLHGSNSGTVQCCPSVPPLMANSIHVPSQG